MKKTLKLSLCALAGAMLAGCTDSAQGPASVAPDALASGFVAPPDSIQTSVYWYWISNNISKEGVEKDLESMKKAGINRAFIGNIGQDDVPYGNVKMLSEEWWDILHAALKKATELDIEIGIFNSPGWSQSGGPWVTPEQAMRYLASSETRVKGPQKLSVKLDKPIDIFQDVRVIAYPAPKDDLLALDASNGTITSSPAVAGLNKVVDGDKTTGIAIPKGGKIAIDFKAKEPFTARSLTIKPTEHPMGAKGELQVKEGNDYRTLTAFDINRTNTELNVGFDRYAPVVVSIPATTATDFRVVISGANEGSGLTEVTLAAAPRVERYSEKTLAKMHPTPLPYWKDYQWPAQPAVDDAALTVDAAAVQDISQYMAEDGTLNWDVPEGEWVILRMGMTPTGTTNSPASPEATGYETDKMSKEHIEKHFEAHMGEILRRIPAEDRKTFRVVVQDSYETGGQNFTDGMIEEFQTRYGYDPTPFLPVYNGIVVESPEASDRFLWDVRRMVADKVAYDYVGGLRDVSHKYGLHTWLENYGHWGFPGEFLMYGGQSDEIGGEFWSEGDLGDIENRAASSCGHIYGKTKISAESNTCAANSFARYPGVIKQRGDRFFAEGINNTLLHVYITQPDDRLPGVNAWFGNEFNRHNTWFSQIDAYITYLKRANFMLQQGLNVADVAYFIGEDAPKMTGIADPALPTGYQFDYMNAEVIEKYMTVKDGKITLPHGTQYRILVLPKLETMRPEVLAKIQQLVKDGAIVMGPAPSRSPSQQNQPAADEQVKAMAAEMWGDVDGQNVKSRQYGKGMILDGMTMEEAFALIDCIPDCRIPDGAPVHYGHRTLRNGEIYFVSNQSDETITVTPEFRVTGLQPELWNPVTGEIRNLPAYEQKAGATAVPMKLAPYESAFVVFNDKAGAAAVSGVEANYPEATIIAEIQGPWSVDFLDKVRGPQEPVVFETLTDWTANADDKIKYYSGSAVYKNTFELDAAPTDNNILLNLNDFVAMARVKVNGRDAGTVWTAPYKVDITELVKEGKNEVEIEVVNTWVNRLIGDQKLPEAERTTWVSINPWKADSPLQKAGLLGPVVLESVTYIE
ncbi:glycosyl hydrolase [uncultured Alistipes sp.]|uniref:glycosyl hydrolase n=1 Tax=uncultured Alistipes sp. TaxID=538949 RepID=UPI00262061E5|nr:glycosyl hydrolase [uncultured Alistipes sp.]